MKVFMIGYDLFHKDGAAYDKLKEEIKAIGGWCHCLDSTWFVKSMSDAGTIRNLLLEHLGKDDKLLVTEVKYSANWGSWNLGEQRNQWLKENA
jgi:hypothetical protein